MTLLFLHALFVFAGTNILMAMTGAPPQTGIGILVRFIGFAAFVPFSLATSAGLHGHKGLAIGLVVAITIVQWPFDLGLAPIYYAPVAGGLILGTLCRSFIHDTTEPDPQP